jgi:hypothetical protein
VHVFAVDWSGAAVREDRHLWVAEVDADTARVVSLAPSTRVAAVDQLIRAAEGPAELIAGLDFSFSLPAWWLRTNDISTVDDLWADSGRLEAWLASCRPPFWGRPGCSRPRLPAEQEFRRTELAVTPRPRSTFQIGGAGAVGTGSLRGMPQLARLRAAGLAIWPWDPWSPPVVAEVWPRLALGRAVKSSPVWRARWVVEHRHALDEGAAACIEASDDALDAAAAALHLAARTGWARRAPVDDSVALEGWIDGVDEPVTPVGAGEAERSSGGGH